MAFLRLAFAFVMGTITSAALVGCTGTSTGPDRVTVTETTGNKELAVSAITRVWAILDAVARQRLNDVSRLPQDFMSKVAEAAFGVPVGPGPVYELPSRPSMPAAEPGTACDPSGCGYVDYLQETLYADRIDGAVRVTSTGGTRRLSITQTVRGGPSAAIAFTQSMGGAIEVDGTTMRGEMTSWYSGPGTADQITTLVFDAVESTDTGAALVGANPIAGAMTVAWTLEEGGGAFSTWHTTLTFP